MLKITVLAHATYSDSHNATPAASPLQTEHMGALAQHFQCI